MARRAFITGLAGTKLLDEERQFLREAQPFGLIGSLIECAASRPRLRNQRGEPTREFGRHGLVVDLPLDRKPRINGLRRARLQRRIGPTGRTAGGGGQAQRQEECTAHRRQPLGAATMRDNAEKMARPERFERPTLRFVV